MSLEIQVYICPYCNRKSLSPGGVRLHVKLIHPEKLEEFNSKYYKEMIERYNCERKSLQ